MTYAEACDVLSVAPGAPTAVVDAAYRVLAKAGHPDAGGSVERMVLLNEAAETLRTSMPERSSRAVGQPCRSRPLDDPRMPWGKFRGLRMSQTDLSYLAWLVAEVKDSAVRQSAAEWLHWTAGRLDAQLHDRARAA